MPEPQPNQMELAECPRCSTKQAQVVARSPVPGVWTMQLCPVCFYSWRSTEPDYATKATALASDFRVDSNRLAEGKPMPGIPPLRGAR
jgi:hypothetical protein